jgi:DNA transposition AAA+ family ATPase
VYDTAGVQKLQAEDNTSNKKSRFLLTEDAVITQMIPKISAIAIIHHKVEMLTILKGIDHINQKRMF